MKKTPELEIHMQELEARHWMAFIRAVFFLKGCYVQDYVQKIVKIDKYPYFSTYNIVNKQRNVKTKITLNKPQMRPWCFFVLL